MDGDFYVVGQHSDDPQEPRRLQVSIFRFNLTNQQWRRMTTFNGPTVTSMAKLDGKIKFTFDNFSAHSYDPADNTWKEVICLFSCNTFSRSTIVHHLIPFPSDWTIYAVNENFANCRFRPTSLRTVSRRRFTHCEVWQNIVPRSVLFYRIHCDAFQQCTNRLTVHARIRFDPIGFFLLKIYRFYSSLSLIYLKLSSLPVIRSYQLDFLVKFTRMFQQH